MDLGKPIRRFTAIPINNLYTPNPRAQAEFIAAQCTEYSALLRTQYDAPKEGIRAGEVIGWRWWNIQNPEDYWAVYSYSGLKEIRLSSVTSGYIWEPNAPIQIKDATKLEEGMGIHAFRSRKEAEANPCGQVLGTVEMWGEIVEHDKGYRSEWAKIKSLVYLLKVDPLLTELRKI